MADVAAVILAGGKSSRMGKDKAMLRYHGEYLIDTVAKVIRRAGVAALYVSGCYEGYTCIPDVRQNKGPVQGITSCVRSLAGRHERALFVPVDMPLMHEDAILPLIQCGAASCYYEGNPLPCVLSINAARDLFDRQVLDGSDDHGALTSVKQVMLALHAQILPMSGYIRPFLANTNTPEQWNEVLHESAN